MLSDFFDAFDEPVCEIALPEFLGHGAGNVLPEFLAHFCMDPLVAEDDKAAPGGDDEKKDAVPLAGVGHPQSPEGFFGDGPDLPVKKRGDGNADFPRRLFFSGLDGFPYFLGI
jgi:hypothetical protein